MGLPLKRENNTYKDSVRITNIFAKKESMTNTFTAVSILVGTIIGAGFLGIPYVAMQAGFGIGVIQIIAIALIMTLVMLYLGEIIARTKKQHQLVGYAEKYLGKTGKKIMFFSFVFGAYAALLAYMIAEGESWSFLLFNDARYALACAIGFWFLLSIISYAGSKALKESESLGLMLVLVMIVSIVVLNAPKINIENLIYNNSSHILIPLGVIMFSFLGYSILPEVKQVLGNQGRFMKRSIIIAYVLAAIIYLVFTAVVLGFKGQNTPQVATLALGKPFVLLGIITVFNASLALSNSLIDTFVKDFRKTKQKAWLYVMLLPLAFYLVINLLGSVDFVTVISIGGLISGGLTITLILLMLPKAKTHGDRNPEYSMPYSKKLLLLLIILFAIGAILEIKNILG